MQKELETERHCRDVSQRQRLILFAIFYRCSHFSNRPRSVPRPGCRPFVVIKVGDAVFATTRTSEPPRYEKWSREFACLQVTSRYGCSQGFPTRSRFVARCVCLCVCVVCFVFFFLFFVPTPLLVLYPLAFIFIFLFLYFSLFCLFVALPSPFFSRFIYFSLSLSLSIPLYLSLSLSLSLSPPPFRQSISNVLIAFSSHFSGAAARGATAEHGCWTRFRWECSRSGPWQCGWRGCSRGTRRAGGRDSGGCFGTVSARVLRDGHGTQAAQ